MTDLRLLEPRPDTTELELNTDRQFRMGAEFAYRGEHWVVKKVIYTPERAGRRYELLWKGNEQAAYFVGRAIQIGIRNHVIEVLDVEALGWTND